MKVLALNTLKTHSQTLRILALLILLFCSYLAQAQEKKLIGTWVLDCLLDAQGGISTVHTPLFSAEVIYTISPNTIKMNDQSQKANYDSFNNINLLDRTMYYKFDGDYMLLQERGDPDRVMYFLKDSVFLAKYPEFLPQYVERNAEKLLLENAFKKAMFTGSMDFAQALKYYSKELQKKSKSEFFCEIEFVLDSNSKIRDIVIPTAIETKVKDDLLKAVPKLNDYYFNYTGENLLIKQEVQFSTFSMDKSPEGVQKFRNKFYEGRKLYEQNKPEEALKLFEEIKDIQIDRNRYGDWFYNDYLRIMGICYLMVDKQKEACEAFNKLGTKADFNARNFLRFFCGQTEKIETVPDKEDAQ